MTRETRRSGWSLVVVGIVGAAFFLLTDPRFATHPGADYADAVLHASTGTVVGLVGSGLTATVGVWLMMRRTV